MAEGRATVEVDAELDRSSVQQVGRELERGLKGVTARLDAQLKRTSTNLRKFGDEVDLVGRRMQDSGRRFRLMGRIFGGVARIVSTVLSSAFKLAAKGMEAFANVALESGEAAASSAASMGQAAAQASAAAGATAAANAAAASNPVGWIALAAGVAVAGSALAALGVLLGPIIAGLYALAGAAVALGAAVLGGLVGGLALAGAALLPLGVAIGGLIGGFKSMDGAAQDAVKNALLPLKNELKGLGQEFFNAALPLEDLKRNVEEVRAVLQRPIFKELAKGAGEAMADVREAFIGTLESDSFNTFIETINQHLPDQIRTLGAIFNNSFLGVTGTLTAAQPALDDFLNKINEAAIDFNVFANSPGGQKALGEFFDQANDALGSMGGLLKETGELFAKLFMGPAGDVGIELLDSLKGKITELIAFIEANPAAVEEFFREGGELARDLGDSILKIITKLGELNTPGNRDLLRTMFDGAVIGANVFVEALKIMGFLIAPMIRSFGFMAELIGTVIGSDALTKFGAQAQTAADGLLNTALGIDTVKGKLTELNGHKVIISIDKKQIVVANEEAAKLARQKYPDAEIIVDKGQIEDANTAAENAKTNVGELDKATATPTVTVKVGGDTSWFDKIRSFFASYGKNVTASFKVSGGLTGAVGGVMDRGLAVQGFKGPKYASGGVVNAPTFYGNALIGEAGAEAIVPLGRSLSQVDSSVRALSAFAQGKLDTNPSSKIEIINNYYGPMTGADRLQELDWTLRYAPRISPGVGV